MLFSPTVYALLPHGASMGEGYGRHLSHQGDSEKAEAKKNCPSLPPAGLTTAHLLLENLAVPKLKPG
jgi:predicted solute-binding protein